MSERVAHKLEGRSVFLVGSPDYGLDQVKKSIEAEGAKIVDKLTKSVDLIVELPRTGKGRADALKQAKAWNKKGEAAIEIVPFQDLQDRTQPTPDEVVALLLGDADDRERLKAALFARHYQMPPLVIRTDELAGLKCADRYWGNGLAFEDSDLSNSDLSGWRFKSLEGTKLDGAKLHDIDALDGCKKSSFVGASMHQAMLRHSSECDLSDADMREFRGGHGSLEKCVLRRANLAQADLSNARLVGSDFGEATLDGANLSSADLTGANLAKANCANAVLIGAVLKNADLRGASFVNAGLSNANFEGAQIDGADFTGASTAGANFGDLELGKAKGLEVQKALKAGPKLKALVAAAKKAERIQTSVEIDLRDGTKLSGKIDFRPKWGGSSTNLVITRDKPGSGPHGVHSWAKGLEEAVLSVVTESAQGVLRVESITAKSEKSPVSGKALKTLVVEAWCEAFELPTGEGLDAVAEAEKRTRERANDWKETLREGPRGVRRWNHAKNAERPEHLRGIKLGGANLAGLDASQLDLAKADLSGAMLAEANLYCAKLGGANLAGADLRATNMQRAGLGKVKLDGANLSRANLSGAQLVGASLVKADLTEVDLENANLRAAVLTGAVLTRALLEGAEYDEATLFPAGFTGTAKLTWKGEGRPPKEKSKTPATAIDLATFIKRLEKNTDSSRWSKALAMLKKERFQLFSEVTDERIVGVVKSQNDPDLVYACSLAESGAFSCCTQNLNVCGGLRGALCKHLLVLVVGLGNAKELDPTKLDEWVKESRRGSHELDRDKMSEIFLRYKGAESGEIDWRPVETIPEDYYAL